MVRKLVEEAVLIKYLKRWRYLLRIIWGKSIPGWRNIYLKFGGGLLRDFLEKKKKNKKASYNQSRAGEGKRIRKWFPRLLGLVLNNEAVTMSQLFISPMGVSLFERKEALEIRGAPYQNKLSFSSWSVKILTPKPHHIAIPCTFLAERNTSLSPWFTTLPETQNNQRSFLTTCMSQAHWRPRFRSGLWHKPLFWLKISPRLLW